MIARTISTIGLASALAISAPAAPAQELEQAKASETRCKIFVVLEMDKEKRGFRHEEGSCVLTVLSDGSYLAAFELVEYVDALDAESATTISGSFYLQRLSGLNISHIQLGNYGSWQDRDNTTRVLVQDDEKEVLHHFANIDLKSRTSRAVLGKNSLFYFANVPAR